MISDNQLQYPLQCTVLIGYGHPSSEKPLRTGTAAMRNHEVTANDIFVSKKFLKLFIKQT